MAQETTGRAALQPERGVVPLDEVDSPLLKRGLAYWEALRGDRPFPTRDQVSPRDMLDLLRNVLLLRVVDNGADYEFRIVGDAHVQAHGHNLQGQRLTNLEQGAPRYAAALRRLYDGIVENRLPVAMRGWFARGEQNTDIVYSESLFLPLGERDNCVDHVLVFTAYAPRLT